MKKIVFIVAFSLCILGAGNQCFADFATGLAAYNAKNYDLAFKEWLEAAERDEVAAQRNLGHLYRWGKGVEKNPSRAAYWYHRAAKIGFDRAQFNLGMLYLNGEGVPQSYQDAYKWLTLAKKQGNENAAKEIAKLEKEKGKDFFKIGKMVKKQAPKVVVAKEQTKKIASLKKKQLKKTAKKQPVKVKNKVNNMAVSGVKKGELIAHIGSYKLKKNLDSGWSKLVRKHKELNAFEKFVKEIDFKNKGHYMRLFAKGDGEKVKNLCKQLNEKDVYCVVYNLKGWRVR